MNFSIFFRKTCKCYHIILLERQIAIWPYYSKFTGMTSEQIIKIVINEFTKVCKICIRNTDHETQIKLLQCENREELLSKDVLDHIINIYGNGNV